MGHSISRVLARANLLCFVSKSVQPQALPCFRDMARPTLSSLDSSAWSLSPWRALIALFASELVGSFFVALAIGLAVVGNSLLGLTAIGFTYMVCMYSLVDVSGGHFNPAVTFCMLCSKKIEPNRAMIYVVAQCSGAMLGAVCYVRLAHPDSGPFHLLPPSWGRACVLELLYTAMICFVYLTATGTRKNLPNQYYGLAIALCYIGAGTASGPVTGGVCFNPAVAMAITGTSLRNKKVLLLYGFAELLGAFLASWLHRVCHLEEYIDEDQPTRPPKLLAEFFGTFYLVLTAGLSFLGRSAFAVWGIAAVYSCQIYAFGSISGAHLNPAVTLAMTLGTRGVDNPIGYVIAQACGGISGAALSTWLMAEAEVEGVTKILPAGPLTLSPGQGYGKFEAGLAEMLFTFLLCFVAMSVQTIKVKDLREVSGFAVGSCFTAGGFAVGKISGASLNPAVSLGLYVAGRTNGVRDVSVFATYVAGELLGAIFAFLCFSATRPNLEPVHGSIRRKRDHIKDSADSRLSLADHGMNTKQAEADPEEQQVVHTTSPVEPQRPPECYGGTADDEGLRGRAPGETA